tara:strand:+ start:508 stop:1506 length:999 start_codon:yes stop_codon:yes gene_type:complete
MKKMVISRTPLRMSFVGGGTDYPEYYRRWGGEVISTPIDYYITVEVSESSDNRIYLDYLYDNEVVDSVSRIKHDILRECLKYTGYDSGIRIAVTTDLPVVGSGLGSSSALTVGTLLALYTYSGVKKSQYRIANDACEIELKILGRPNGKQDQFGTAIGGFKHIKFNSDFYKPCSDVVVYNFDICKNRKLELRNNLMLFYTGVQRQADDILQEQVDNTVSNYDSLHKCKNTVAEMKKVLLCDNISLDYFAVILDEYWHFKRKLASSITNGFFDEVYDKAMDSGAIGGKILGAGGGGFFLFYVKPESQYSVRKALGEFTEFRFGFDDDGVKIVE